MSKRKRPKPAKVAHEPPRPTTLQPPSPRVPPPKLINKGTVGSFLTFSLGGVLNFFGSDPRILYLPAFALCAFILFFTHSYVAARVAERTAQSVPPAPPPPDYLAGTHNTRAELDQLFPFGYVVFHFAAGRLISEPDPNGKVEWKVDWSKVTIAPDFVTRQVTWTINDPAAQITRDGVTYPFFTIKNIAYRTSTPLTVGPIFNWMLVSFYNQPTIHLGTLSDNQRDPVFVMGMRIPTPEPSK